MTATITRREGGIIAIFKGFDGRYSYAPEAAVPLLRLDYGEFDSAAEAKQAVKRDKSIPAHWRVIVEGGET